MKKLWVPVISLLLSPTFLQAQDFNDQPGRDDERYLSLLFPASQVPAYLTTSDEVKPVKNTIVADHLISYAMTHLGTPYRGGATGNGAFDCSGFTQNIFKQAGIALPHSSGAQSNVGRKVEIEEVQPGDLLFFKGRNRNSHHVGHVAMVSEVLPDGTIKMVHATIGKGVMVDTPFQSSYYKSRYISARRVLEP